MHTIGTLFCGAGGKTLGAIQAGGVPIWAIEYDRDIAKLYEHNVSSHIIVDNILNINPKELESPDILLISPPCPSFSLANKNRKELENDILLSNKVVEFIQVLQPNYILIENVSGYIKSNSFENIKKCLVELNYCWDANVLNFADFGVPQTRKRLIVRASKKILPAINTTHAKFLDKNKLVWNCWYNAVSDLITELPNSKLANWQQKQLQNKILPNICLIERSGAGKNLQIKLKDEPCFTIRAMSGIKSTPSLTQANILIASGGHALPRLYNEPSMTVLPGSISNKIFNYEDYRCHTVTVPMLARIQTFPDEYNWCSSRKIATKAIGNAVPPLVIKNIISQWLNNV